MYNKYCRKWNNIVQDKHLKNKTVNCCCTVTPRLTESALHSHKTNKPIRSQFNTTIGSLIVPVANWQRGNKGFCLMPVNGTKPVSQMGLFQDYNTSDDKVLQWQNIQEKMEEFWWYYTSQPCKPSKNVESIHNNSMEDWNNKLSRRKLHN